MGSIMVDFCFNYNVKCKTWKLCWLCQKKTALLHIEKRDIFMISFELNNIVLYIYISYHTIPCKWCNMLFRKSKMCVHGCVVDAYQVSSDHFMDVPNNE